VANTLPASRLPLIFSLSDPASFYDQIDGVGYTVWPDGTQLDLSVRLAASRTPVLSEAPAVVLSPPDLSGNNVRYDWQPSDIASIGEGTVYAWWGITLPGSSRIESPEFPLLFSDHGPGLGTQTGAIVDGAARFMPVTFTALQKDVRFGDRRLQHLANIVQVKVLGSSVSPDQEEAAYELELLEFLSKRVALDLITPGIDFWSRQLQTATSSQTSETTSFPNMITSLTNLRGEIARGLAADWRSVQLLVPGVPSRTVVSMPTSSLSGYRNITRDPQTNAPLRTGWFSEDLGFFPFP
jgi:hypothetical protein